MTDLVHVSSGTLVPVAKILGFAADVEVPTVVHRIIGTGTPDFTMQPAGPRTGTFRLFSLTSSAADDLLELLHRPGAFAISGAEAAFANLAFYVTGNIGYELDEDTLLRVIVSVDWTEAG